jgi:hypothetical protein
VEATRILHYDLKHHISCLDGRLLMKRFGMKPPLMKPDIASSKISN